MSLDEIFSRGHMYEYSKACFDLAVDIPASRHKDKRRKFDTLVIPSRGAFPFFLGMVYSLSKLKEVGGSQEDFYKRLQVPRMLSSLLPEGVSLKEKYGKKTINTLLIPFTADLNVTKYDSTMNNSEITTKTRGYWANVTRSFFRKPSERKKDPYFLSFTDFILKDVEGRKETAEMYESFPEINRFAMIDTVISGRASHDILKAFDEIAEKEENDNFKPSSFLIVDKDGSQLDSKYAWRVRHKVHIEGMANMYPIPAIVSEDRGASLLGVAATMYPSIMKLSQDFELDGKEFFIGAGSWHKSSDLPNEYQENFKAFMDVIYKGIDLHYKMEYDSNGNGEEVNKEDVIFRKAAANFIERAGEKHILRETSEDILVLNPSNRYTYDPNYETGSHVLHAPFTYASEIRALSKITSLPGVRKKQKFSDLKEVN